MLAWRGLRALGRGARAAWRWLRDAPARWRRYREERARLRFERRFQQLDEELQAADAEIARRALRRGGARPGPRTLQQQIQDAERALDRLGPDDHEARRVLTDLLRRLQRRLRGR
jgi:hypothetical protein